MKRIFSILTLASLTSMSVFAQEILTGQRAIDVANGIISKVNYRGALACHDLQSGLYADPKVPLSLIFSNHYFHNIELTPKPGVQVTLYPNHQPELIVRNDSRNGKIQDLSQNLIDGDDRLIVEVYTAPASTYGPPIPYITNIVIKHFMATDIGTVAEPAEGWALITSSSCD